MKIDTPEYLLARIASSTSGLQAAIGDVEYSIYRDQVEAREVTSPIFLTGLARSGSTILLTVLDKAHGVDGHQYRDYPLIFYPIIWNRLQRLLTRGREDEARERAHKDGILITRESRDAFEEPLWRHFFTLSTRNGVYGRVLDRSDWNPEFNEFFTQHLKKILLLRDCDRYLSKGNYNILRIPYLMELFPDAGFLIPVRHPMAHVMSLVRQHLLFTEYARTDSRVAKYMEMLGHYEFGPQRCVPGIDTDYVTEVQDHWASDRHFSGYALIWSAVYRWIHDYVSSTPSARSRVHFVRHEDLCKNPESVLDRLAHDLGLVVDQRTVAEATRLIKPSKPERVEVPRTELDPVQKKLRMTADLFAYDI